MDCFSSITLSILKHFGVEAGVRFKIKSRGAVPLGGGFVEFTCPSVRELHPVNLTDPGKIKRVRGVAHSIRCSPQFANRIVEKVRGVYNDFIPDVYINTDCSRGPESANPGYGVALYAESTTGFTLSARECWPRHRRGSQSARRARGNGRQDGKGAPWGNISARLH